jgi:DNA-binding transcriptional LysR family regulator
MNDMEISCFLSVARTGSFTVSARELSSTQQAVSRNIQSLETELGYPLLHRGSNAVTLTWAGERFLQWRMEHDAQLSTLERQSRRMSPQGANELFLAWNDWTGCPADLENDLHAFREAYPVVQLHMRQGSTEEVTQMLLDGNADIAVLPEYSTHNLTGLIVTPPFAELPLYVISRDLAEEPAPEVLAGITQVAAVMGEDSTESVRRRIHMFCAEIGIAPKRLEILPNVRSTFTQLLCGSCYTIAPRSGFAGGLQAFPLPGLTARLVFVTPQGRISPWGSLLESFIRQRRGNVS